MSSRFARRGTTGYRWPKVCRTVRPPPVVEQTCVPMLAPILLADITINDPDFPFNNFTVTAFPANRVGVTLDWTASPGPGGSNSYAIILHAGSDNGVCQWSKSMIPYSTPTDLPRPTTGSCYDVTRTVLNGLAHPCGTARIYS